MVVDVAVMVVDQYILVVVLVRYGNSSGELCIMCLKLYIPIECYTTLSWIMHLKMH